MPSGTGFSMQGEDLLTAWQDDPCDDQFGFTIYLREVESQAAWSACGAPLEGGVARRVTASATDVTIDTTCGRLDCSVRIEVLADRAAERRVVALTNRGASDQLLEVTGYLEVVLASPAAQEGHPAFSKLFVQTCYDTARQMLVATRRPRANLEQHPALGLALLGARAEGYETDRARFLGRGRSGHRPAALTAPLSGSLGNVLDPVLAIRTRVHVPAGETRTFTFALLVAAEGPELAAHLAAAAQRAELAPARPIVAGADPAIVPQAILELVRGTAGDARAAAWPAPEARAPVHRAVAAVPYASRCGNGYGEFVDDGRAYRIVLTGNARGELRLPPMPWTNVIANERFGVIASEKGSLSTFAGNSRLHRLTPWRNDPIVDPHDEALYLRDETDGSYWSALPGPTPGADSYEVRHGWGYSSWKHTSGGLEHEVTVFVPRRDTLRIALIRIRNPLAVPRKLALYSYQRWVLGGTPAQTRGGIVASIDARRKAVLAHNPAAGSFAAGIAFAAFAGADTAPVDATFDRRQFLGMPGSLVSPRAVALGGALTAGQSGEPCAALRMQLSIPAGGELCVAALLGEADSPAELDRLLEAYRIPGVAETALAEVQDYWSGMLSATQVKTPCPEVDVMVNGWLGYQTLVCRLWARSAYYQSGGAFGFRDQLQDAAALLLMAPELLREQLLRNAAHQFVQGDVLHWWHPPDSDGIRTRFADDLVWLAYLAAHYVRVTGDRALLDEEVGFVSGAELAAEEDEQYFRPGREEATATFYEHCTRALEKAMTLGVHGLPLFGSGDWNDGMNRVGRLGKGESVWMGFFLVTTITDFLPLARARDDLGRVATLERYRSAMILALNDGGWDGAWYRRGYYDSGAPLGSAQSDECRIDALAQAWAVISRVAPAARREQALDSLDEQLISDADRLIRLLAPPFEHTAQDPGYIKGYVAGVRENGGQYTHAALWVVRAMAEAGRRERAAQLLAMLSPATHGADAAGIERYKVEPYVVAADVYGVAPHVGRGGWTWYTGSAGWMLRVALESVLGFGIEDGKWLTLAPRVPDAWPGFELTHRRPDGTSYVLTVVNPERSAAMVVAATVDGTAIEVEGGVLRLPLASDGARHLVQVTLGAGAP